MSGAEPDAGPARPLLTVVRGEPTAEQLAALVAVVSARAAAADAADSAAADAAAPAPSAWAAPVLRAPLRPGPGAWWASGMPH